MTDRSPSTLTRRALLVGGAITVATPVLPAFARRRRGAPRRTLPMFKDEADARAIIKRHCIDEADEPIRRTDADMLVTKLRPQFWIAPLLKTEKSPFRGHFGGAPTMSKDAAWPMRPPALHAKPFIESLWQVKKGDPWLTDYVAREVPFEFIAQIDLTEAAQHPQISAGLPTSGRLHFFWDDIIGIYVGGAAACKVVWDDAPIDALTPVPIPSVFEDLERAWAVAQHRGAKAGTADMLAALPGTIELMRKAGVAEGDIEAAAKAIREQAASPSAADLNLKKPFVYPRRRMKLQPILHLPHTHSAETILDADLAAFLPSLTVEPSPGFNRDAAYACYSMLVSNDEGPFAGSSRSASEARRMRFLGTPSPEQDDPRYESIDKSGYPTEGGWPAAITRDAATQASAWQLLLQVSVADLTQQPAEGTIYFIIRNEDLARRDFSQVHAYYQQT